MERIGVFQRAIAAIIDGIILGLLNGIAAFAILPFLPRASIKSLTAKGEDLNFYQEIWTSGIAPLVIVTFFLSFLYWLIEVRFLASPGKMMFGIFICNADGEAPTILQTLFRSGLKNCALLTAIAALITAKISPGLEILFLTLGWLGGIVVFFGSFLILLPGKQTIYDLVTSTAVYPQYPRRMISSGKRTAGRRPAMQNSADQEQQNRPTSRAVDELIFK